MRAVHINRFGSPEVPDVGIPNRRPAPASSYSTSRAAGVNFADTHHRLS
jgi:NADPH:quinone reductase-like Zn-dependent oxidoreductase